MIDTACLTVGESLRERIVLFLIVTLFSGLFAESAMAKGAFKNVSEDLGLSPANGATAWADYNNDGWVDLCAGGTLWENRSGKGFKEVAGKGTGVFGDYDNDGMLDLFVFSEQKLFRNAGEGNFEEVAIAEMERVGSVAAGWGDVNGDGFIDLYVGGYEDWGNQITYPDRLLVNQKGKSFTVAWSEVRYRARGVTFCDYDRDGDADVYVSNYRLQPNLLWRNDGKGTFVDVAAASNAQATSEGFGGGHSIGSAWGDFDNDGLFDIFAGNFAHVDSRGDQPKSRFLRNTGVAGNCVFDDRSTCGVYYQESYATPAAADYDNDGDLDLFFTTVYGTASFGKANHPVLYRNDGDWSFVDVTEEEGLASLEPTYQAAWGDFDNDGDLDLATAGKLFANQGNSNHWLKVRLAGDGRKVNAAAIGAQVRIKLKGKILTRQVEAGTGQGNQNDLTLHFGLGAHGGPVELEIFWPGGAIQRLQGVRPDCTLGIQFPIEREPVQETAGP